MAVSVRGLTLESLRDVVITSPSNTQVLTFDDDLWVNAAGGGGGGGTPGGPDTSIQFNNSGSFGGSADFTWNGVTAQAPVLSVTGGQVFNDGDLYGVIGSVTGDDFYAGQYITGQQYNVATKPSGTLDVTNLTGLFINATSQVPTGVTLTVGRAAQFNFQHTAAGHLGSGMALYAQANGTAGTIDELFVQKNYIYGDGAMIANYYGQAFYNGITTSPITNLYLYWAQDFTGTATNPYYLWFDSRGVYRIREDNTFDSVGQAIPSLYNPLFTKYTAGAANYERIIEQWRTNVAEIGTEAGGTGTLRALRLLGSAVQAQDGAGNYIDIKAASFTMAGSALRTDTTDGHTGLIQAYDVDGAAYKTFATLTNGNTPSFALAFPSGGTLTGNFSTLQVNGVNVATGSTTPGGSNTQVQYNNSSAFGGITGATTDGTTLTLIAPVLGAATATSINKVAITAPASAATLTIANNKTLTVNQSLTLAGTDSTTMTFPSTSATIARTDAANSFSGAQTITPGGSVTALTLTGATETTSQPLISATQTWNASGTTFRAAVFNITNTASAAASRVIDVQSSGSSVASIDVNGQILARQGSYNNLGFAFTGVSNTGLYYNSGILFDIGGTVSFLVGASSLVVPGATFGLCAGGNSTADLIFTRVGAANLQLGADVNGAAVSQTINAANGITGTDKTGGNLTLNSGKGTGAGAVSQVLIGTPTVLGSGTTAQSITTRVTIDSSGLKATGYLSSDGSAGVTAGPFTTITSITVKNGLVTALSGS